MGPRKKSKPNPKAPASRATPDPQSSTAPEPSNPSSSTSEANEPIHKTPSESTATDPVATIESPAPSGTTGKQNNKFGRKWLGGTGSWRSKASPVAQIANQSIGVVRGATSELAAGKQGKEDTDSPRKLLSKRRSSKGNAIPAAMTKLNVSSSGEVSEQSKAAQSTGDVQAEPTEPKHQPVQEAAADPPLPPDPPKSDTTEKKTESDEDKQAASTFGWRSWWSRPDGYAADSTKPKDHQKDVDMTDAQTTPLPGPTPSEEAPDKLNLAMSDGVLRDDKPDSTKTVVENATEAKADTDSNTVDKGTQGRSWFRLWSSAQNAQANPPPTEPAKVPELAADDVRKSQTAAELPPTGPETGKSAQEISKKDSAKVEPKPAPPPKSSGWAFWSRDKPQEEETKDAGPTHKQVGELAVADTPSQSHPEAAQFNEEEPTAQKQLAKPIRTKGKDTSKESSRTATPSQTTPARSPSRPVIALEPQPAPKQAPKPKQEPTNLILPEFRNTYRLVQKPTYWEQIRRYFLGNETATPHLHINPVPPRIKKAIAIGVHGYFPAPIFQKFLGQPTGTSIRFANAAAEAIREWTKARGYECEVEKAALEGEGFIADRVNTLWKLLLNWIDAIKQADFILVACHSQGVPVAIMLLAKLIQFGCVNGARIGVCAMAGVNLGPFVEYKTRYFGATAAELFEFSNPKSLVSQMYLTSLEEVLAAGVRIVYVGSLDDQLVSLESSTFSTISHPYIYRAVFVDGRIHAPDFISHLIGFALKLRNLGLPDHGLIRELSPALAGSIVSGEGHSRIYEDPAVYSLAVNHALETTGLPITPAQQRPSTAPALSVAAVFDVADNLAKQKAKDPYALKVNKVDASASANPYYLPWALRGLLEEDFVKKELGTEVEQLLGMFENWKPQSKMLKDVKFRLEVIRSKL